MTTIEVHESAILLSGPRRREKAEDYVLRKITEEAEKWFGPCRTISVNRIPTERNTLFVSVETRADYAAYHLLHGKA